MPISWILDAFEGVWSFAWWGRRANSGSPGFWKKTQLKPASLKAHRNSEFRELWFGSAATTLEFSLGASENSIPPLEIGVQTLTCDVILSLPSYIVHIARGVSNVQCT